MNQKEFFCNCDCGCTEIVPYANEQCAECRFEHK